MALVDLVAQVDRTHHCMPSGRVNQVDRADLVDRVVQEGSSSDDD